jgi:hypothetical protein
VINKDYGDVLEVESQRGKKKEQEESEVASMFRLARLLMNAIAGCVRLLLRPMAKVTPKTIGAMMLKFHSARG